MGFIYINIVSAVFLCNVSKLGKLHCGHRTGKSQSSFQSQRRAMTKNVQTAEQLISHASNVMLKILQARLQQYMTENFQMDQLSLKKAEEAEIKRPTFTGSKRKQRDSRKASASASLTTPKPLTVWITTNCGKFLREYQTTLPTSWEICMQVKKQQLQLDMKQWLVPNWERGTSRLYIVTLLI